MILPEHKIAFLHVPKCGGYSIRSSLFQSLGLDIENLTAEQRHYYGEEKNGPRGVHATLRELESEIDLSGWRILATVREPLERAVSQFHYQQRPDVGLPILDFDASVQCGHFWKRAVNNHSLSQTQFLKSEKGNIVETIPLPELDGVFPKIHGEIFGHSKSLTLSNQTKYDYSWKNLSVPSIHSILNRWGEDYQTFPQFGKNLKGGSAVNIVMAMDLGAFKPTATVVNSVSKNLAAGRRAHFRIFCRQFNPPDTIYGSNFTVEFLKPSTYLRSNLPNHVSQSANDRLLSLNFLDWDKCILLDYDQLALADISEMFDLHVDGYARGRKVELTAYDAASRWFHTTISDTRKEAAKTFPLMSFGAIINIKKCREDALLPKIQKVLDEEAIGEQLAFCLAAKGDYSDLDSKWNTLQTLGDEVTEDSRIIHFSMPAKPWWNRNMAHAKKWLYYETTWEDLRSESGVYTATCRA